MKPTIKEKANYVPNHIREFELDFERNKIEKEAKKKKKKKKNMEGTPEVCCSCIS